MDAQLSQQAVFDKDLNVVVNRGQRERRDFLPHPLKNSFGGRVIAHLHQLLINDQPLMSEGKARLMAALPEIRHGEFR